MANIERRTSPQGADQSSVRRYNRAQILNHIRLQGAISRADLAKQVGLTRSTISRIVDELLSENLVREIVETQNDRGRPSIPLSLNPKGGAAIGLEIGVHFISILLTDFLSTPIWRNRVTLTDHDTWNEYIQKSEALIGQAIEIAGKNELMLMGIGVAVWGLVNDREHTIQFAPNLHWRNITLESKWAQLYQVPIYVENDANASALGEYYFGVGKMIEDFIYLSMDIGVGSGIISKGRLFRGAIGFAGEIGHITIDPAGPVCSCGRQGCLETVVGSHVIVKRYEELSKETGMNLEKIIQRGQAGDPISKKVFSEVGEALGIAISYAVNLFNPSGIILGWSLGQAFDLLLPGIKKTFEKFTLLELRENVVIIPSINGADDALLGGVALVLDEIIREAM